MAQAIGTLVGIVLLMLLFSFFVYFSGWIGLFAAAGALIGGGLLVAVASGSRLALRIFSSRAWLMPLGAFALILALAPLVFEENFCGAQIKSGTAAELYNVPSDRIVSASLEGECLADGGLMWAMQQPTAIVRVVLLLGGVFVFGFAFSGKREPPPPPPPPKLPVQKVSQLTDFPPDLAARLKTPAVPVPPSSDGTVNRWTPEMVALLREAAALNGGFVDLALLDRLGREPAFSTVTSRGMAAKARSIGIEYQKTQRVE